MSPKSNAISTDHPYKHLPADILAAINKWLQEASANGYNPSSDFTDVGTFIASKMPLPPNGR